MAVREGVSEGGQDWWCREQGVGEGGGRASVASRRSLKRKWAVRVR